MKQTLFSHYNPLNKKVFFLLSLFLIPAAVSLSGEPSFGPNGAALYHKHCWACHRDPNKLKADANIIDIMRNPMPTMPKFDRDKINDPDARAIVDFIRHGAGNIKEASVSRVTPSEPISTSPTVTVEPERKPIADTAIIDVPAPVPVKPGKSNATHKTAKNMKSWRQSFVRKWTVKGVRNGQVETLQAFEITSNANHELAVVPLVKLSAYTIKVTEFEIIEKTLRLQFTSTWKYSPSSRTIETLEFVLSDDGKKMSGMYSMRTSGSSDAGQAAWAE